MTVLKDLLNFIIGASPANRDVGCAYVVLEDRSTRKVVGTYVQGFYQLAKVGGLRCQIEARGQDAEALRNSNLKLYRKLYHAGKLKSPFELAVINKVAKNDIQNVITEEYTWQNNDPRGLLPQEVSKYRMGPEWLNQLNSKLKPKFCMVGSPQRLTITVDNKGTPRDTRLHAMAQTIGMLVTLTTFMGLVMSLLPVAWLATLSTLSLIGVAAASGLVGFFALKTIGFGNAANFFGIGEVLWNDVPALLSKQFLDTGKRISWGKLARSLGFSVAIAGLAFLAASATFSSILALPFMASLGIGAKILAGLFASSTFIISCIGASGPVRCFAGFGIWDNTIPLEMVNQADIKALKDCKIKDKDGEEISKTCLTALAPTAAQLQKRERKNLQSTARQEYVEKSSKLTV